MSKRKRDDPSLTSSLDGDFFGSGSSGGRSSAGLSSSKRFKPDRAAADADDDEDMGVGDDDGSGDDDSGGTGMGQRAKQRARQRARGGGGPVKPTDREGVDGKLVLSDSDNEGGEGDSDDEEDDEGGKRAKKREKTRDPEVYHTARLKQQGINMAGEVVGEEEEDDHGFKDYLDKTEAGTGRKDTVKEAKSEREKKFEAMDKLFGKSADKFVEPLSMKDEGYFNEEGRFVHGETVKDSWLQEVQDNSKLEADDRTMPLDQLERKLKHTTPDGQPERKAKPAQPSKSLLPDGPFDPIEIMKIMLTHMKPGEDVFAALKRLGRKEAARAKAEQQAKLQAKKKNQRTKPKPDSADSKSAMSVESDQDDAERFAFNQLTEASNLMMNNEYNEIHEVTLVESCDGSESSQFKYEKIAHQMKALQQRNQHLSSSNFGLQQHQAPPTQRPPQQPSSSSSSSMGPPRPVSQSSAPATSPPVPTFAPPAPKSRTNAPSSSSTSDAPSSSSSSSSSSSMGPPSAKQPTQPTIASSRVAEILNAGLLSSNGGPQQSQTPQSASQPAAKPGAKPAAGKPALQWEYKWKMEDTEIHGPFTPEDMTEWRNDGYFEVSAVVARKVGGSDKDWEKAASATFVPKAPSKKAFKF